jgi:unsaturated chondroitin disaccharide hydrolase
MMLHRFGRRTGTVRKTIFCAALLGAAAALSSAHAAETIEALIDRDIRLASTQYAMLLERGKDQAGFPRSDEQGTLKTVGAGDWTAGFFPGSLWYLFEATGNPAWRDAAVRYTALSAPAKFDKSQHDVGFMLGSGYGNGYRLTGNPAYRDALLAGATTLMTRYNPQVGALQSWNVGARSAWTYPVIIDNMMNLELLT